MKSCLIQKATFAVLMTALSTLVCAYSYSKTDTVIGRDFYDFFTWEAMDDPTNGRVDYVDRATAQSLNLTYASDDTFILRSDYTSVLDPSGRGRKSVRIKSRNSYTHHVAVFDIRHMPQGCGTWPAIWQVKDGEWPYGGELDIVEGINDQTSNLAVLHTTQGCTMPNSRQQKGTSVSYDCSNTHSNQGCVVKFPTENSFGPPFNNNGGGRYALERSPDHIKIWFWARDDASVPVEVAKGADVVDPDKWGMQSAYYPNTDACDFASHLWDHVFVINLTFCGWAGDTFSQSVGCPSTTCVDFVNNHPEAFKNAYFDFASIRIYEHT